MLYIWQGVTVEHSKTRSRIEDLQQVGALMKFISFEPLIGPIDNLDIAGIDWVIVGGETGPRWRTMKEEWVIPIRDMCIKMGTPFFFKGWGGNHKKKTNRILDGRSWDQFPECK